MLKVRPPPVTAGTPLTADAPLGPVTVRFEALVARFSLKRRVRVAGSAESKLPGKMLESTSTAWARAGRGAQASPSKAAARKAASQRAARDGRRPGLRSATERVGVGNGRQRRRR